MAEHDILTLEEVAKYLRVSERTVYDWANRGEIPCGKLGTTWRFKRSDIERWVDQKLGAGVPRTPRAGAVSLGDVLVPERCVLLDAPDKEAALTALVDLLAAAPQVRDRELLLKEVFAREALMSTGIGFGVGVPHVRLPSVKDIVMAVGVNARPLADYQSLDGEPVRMVCMVAARDDQHAQYLKTLAAVSALLKQEAVRAAVLAAPDAPAVYALLTGAEA